MAFAGTEWIQALPSALPAGGCFGCDKDKGRPPLLAIVVGNGKWPGTRPVQGWLVEGAESSLLVLLVEGPGAGPGAAPAGR